MRTQLCGVAEIEAALRAGAPVRLLLLRHGADEPGLAALVERARASGVAVRTGTANDLRRMSRADPPPPALALAGPEPGADADAALRSEGAVWLLAGVAYAGNAGYAIRTAEVSGAGGIFLDAGFGPRERRRALRAAMHAERFLPVHWMPAQEVIVRAAEAGRRLVAVEDVGDRAPWEVDLTGPVLLVLGGEGRGIPAELLARCNEVVRVPMAGFVPSYNVQAAMAAVAVERLRQVARRGAP